MCDGEVDVLSAGSLVVGMEGSFGVVAIDCITSGSNVPIGPDDVVAVAVVVVIGCTELGGLVAMTGLCWTNVQSSSLLILV